MEVRRLQEELDALLVMLETMLRREFTNPVKADASSNALSQGDIRSAQALALAQSLYRRLQSFFDTGQALRTGRGEIADMSIFQACDQTDATSPETVEGSKQSRWRLQGAGPQMAEARVTAVPDGLRSSDGAPRPTRPDEEPVTEGGAEETRRYRQGQRH